MRLGRVRRALLLDGPARTLEVVLTDGLIDLLQADPRAHAEVRALVLEDLRRHAQTQEDPDQGPEGEDDGP
jgi:hypothetical protein